MPKNNSIAVVGVSALFPGSVSATGFWTDILRGSDLMSDVPESHWLIEDYYDPDPSVPDKTYAKRGAFLPDVDFDPLAWGVPPSIVPATDTNQLLALVVARQVLDDASQGQFETMDRSRMSVILGVTSSQELLGSMVSRLQHPIWTKSLREAGLSEEEVQDIVARISSNYTDWQESTFPGVLGNVVAGRIANRLDLGGTNCVIDAACASTLSALSMAVNELHLGQSDLVICGGCDTMNDIFMYMCFSKTPALSPTGDCRPFSDQADGTMLGEGLGMVALRRLEDAERDGDRIYATIEGVGASSDGRSKSVYAPVSEGQAQALRRAYDQAGFGPETIELIEAHGTGTAAGDAAEVGGLKMVFDEAGREDRQWCSLGSVKSQIGHTKASAGAAGLLKAIFALHHQVLPPTIKIDRPNPKLEIENSPFNLTQRARPWIRDDDHPRRAGVSSFGFGGSNFHVALEEYHGKGNHAARFQSSKTELVFISGDSAQIVVDRCQAIAGDEMEEGVLRFLAQQSQSDFNASDSARLAVIASNESELVEKLHKAVDLLANGEDFSSPAGIYFEASTDDGKLGFLFPGQGSQYIDMGADLAMYYPEARRAWDLAAQISKDYEQSLQDIVFPIGTFDDDAEASQRGRLTQTEWAQPAIGAASLALLNLADALGLKAAAVAGHSYGEVTALCAASSVSQVDMLRIARRRGELMRDAAAETSGSMTAVVSTRKDLEPLLAVWKIDVVIANHNSPKQVVLSGATEAIDAVEKKLSEEGIKAQRLNVATAFHSSLVSASTVPFDEFLRGIKFSKPKIDVYRNATAEPYPKKQAEIRKALSGQIATSVRFVEQIEAMYKAGVRTFLEVGPSSVLTSFVSKILKGRPHRAISFDRKGMDGVTSFQHAIGRLAVAGVPLRFEALWKDFASEQDPRESVKPKLVLKLNGANYGKPYPPEGGASALPKPNPKRRPVNQALPYPTPVHSPPAIAPTAASTPGSVVGVPAVSAQAIVPLPPVAAAPVAQASPQMQAPVMNDAWLAAYAEMQRQTAEAHSSYQRSMAESHAAFLRSAEMGAMSLSAMLNPLAGGMPMTPPNPIALQPAAPIPTQFVPQVAVSSVPIPVPIPIPPAAPVVAAAPAVAPVAVLPTAVPAPVPVAAAPPVRASAPAPAVELKSLMISVVSEKTGYPVEMLGLEMDLEADLGVDSIKRVEILSAVQDEYPGMPDVDPGELGKMRTLSEIVTYMKALIPDSEPNGVAIAPAAAVAADFPASSEIDLQELMLEVVADKTGYPTEMLGLEMDLEADLGVDSIKRVEILSAVQDEYPEMPDVDPGELGKLRTLAEIVTYMRGLLPSSGTAAATPVAAVPASSGSDLQALMLDVVAEKTGYPTEMLGLEMDLEADLGVDSIKRVEILSAVQDEYPGMPDVDPGELGKMRTLAEIVRYMRGLIGGDGGEASGLTETNVASGADSESMTTATSTPAVLRYPLRAVEKMSLGFATAGLFGAERIAVTDDGQGVAEALVKLFEDRGRKAEVCRGVVPGNCDALIFLGGLRDVDEVQALEVNREAFSAARSLAARFTEQGGTFVSVQDTGGDFGLSGSSRAWLGGLSGLAKTAAQEWPGATVRAIDVERDGRQAIKIARALMSELAEGGNDLEIGLTADGRRWAFESVAETVNTTSDGDVVVDASSVILASGGGRGVTAATLIGLAQSHACRFILLGRSELFAESADSQGIEGDAELKRALLGAAKERGEKIAPAELGAEVSRILANREINATLEAIAAAGGEARYVSADVQDAPALAKAIASIQEEWGGVTGLVHGAGVLADKLIAEKSTEQFDRVFNTKVNGLRALLEVTSQDPLRFLAFFSSVAARCGNQGQCDYAMANEVLNKVAAAERERRADGVVVKSFNWGPWEGGMVSPALKSRFESLGVPLIPLATGARMLVDELTSVSGDDVEIVFGGEPRADALLAEEGPKAREVDLIVDRHRFPYLDGHRVKGEAVVPLTLVLEWFARATRAMLPPLRCVGFSEVRVLKGIRLPHFDATGAGEVFRIRIETLSSGNGATCRVELISTGGIKYYSATVILADDEIAGDGPVPTLSELTPWANEIYGGPLFHGPEFRVVRELAGVSIDGIEASLVGVHEMDWSTGGLQERWQLDPALLDGGLQLALLWTQHMTGGHSLPTSIAAVQLNRGHLPVGTVRCVVKGRQAKAEKCLTDVYLIDANDVLIAELRGVETVVLPGTRPADFVRPEVR